MDKMEVPDEIQVFWSYAEPEAPAVVIVKGSLDLKIAYRLRSVLLELIDLMSPNQDLYIDLRHVDYISSTGVGILSAALTHANDKQVRFYISTLTAKVRSVFDSLGLISWFTEKDLLVSEP